MVTDNPGRQNDIDFIMEMLYTVMNTSKQTIRISGTDMPAMAVIRKLMKLNNESIMYAIEKFSEQTERIKNPTAYLLAILCHAPEQYHFDTKNQVSHDMAPPKHETAKKGLQLYNSYPQRTYDYEALERELLK